MKKVFWRISYKEIGIYEALKKSIWERNINPKEEWLNLKESNEFTWLKTPPTYNINCTSYFTEQGYNNFMKITFPILIKYLDKNKIISKKYNIDISKRNVLYIDENQIVIEEKE